MKNSVKIRFGYYTLLIVVLGLSGLTAFGQDKEKIKTKTYQKEFCSNNWSGGDRVSVNELREFTLGAGSLTVDGRRNGGIRVKGENRSDILVRACVQASASSDDLAASLARSVRIETAPVLRADAPEESNWGVSYEIRVPHLTNLKLTTANGGISIADVEGTIEFEASNGGIKLSNLAGDVRGRTTNGGINVELTGSSWRGTGLNVQTTNGGVHMSVPENYSARFETRTVNGGFKSDFAVLNVEKDEKNWSRGVDLSRDLNGGGATIRAVTTNGGVKITAAGGKVL